MKMATRWGICSAGLIAYDFVIAMKCLPTEEHEIRCVASRDLSRAQEFAAKFDIPKVHGSYQDLAEDPDIDVVFIGAIQSDHDAICRTMMESGKNILCQKPLTVNRQLTEGLVQLAKEKDVFLMEALWSRFMPSYQKLKSCISEGVIGDPILVTADFCLDFSVFDTLIDQNHRRDLGAGSITDLGPFTLGFPMWVFGDEYPEDIIATGHVSDAGIDESSSVVLKFSKGRTAIGYVHTKLNTGCQACVYGTKGKLYLDFPMWAPTKLVTPKKTYNFRLPEWKIPSNFINTTGMSYQADAVRECLLKGMKECPTVSHDVSLKLASINEEVRRQLGVRQKQQ